MLNKVLKYDLKWIYKVLIIFYLLALFFSISTRLCLSIDSSLLFNILGKISSGFTISMIISALINCMMRSWVRFIRNIYKDESYLTHTLPLKRSTIYLSKVLSTIICLFTTFIISIICLFICYYSKENIEILKSILEITANTYNITVINLLLIIFFVIFLEILFIILLGFVGIILGHQKNNNKILKSIIISFGMYILTQLITLMFILLLGVFNKDIMNLINTTEMININIIKNLLFATIFMYIIYIGFYFILGKKELEKGVNIE